MQDVSSTPALVGFQNHVFVTSFDALGSPYTASDQHFWW